MTVLGPLFFAAALVAQDTAIVSVRFLDVGQSDAVLIASPEGHFVLVDAARSSRDVARALRGWEIDTLDLVVASHADADHIGGLAAVFGTVPVRYYLDNGLPHTTATYRDLMWTVERSSAVYLQPTARTISLGSVTLRVLPPLPTARSQNSASLGLIVEYGDFRVLLPGDADQDALNHFLQLGVPQISVLKAAHHGARNGVTPGWVLATRPRVVAISVGSGNSYGHPDSWALRYYGRYAEAIYRTDLDGEILVQGRRDGSFTVFTWDQEGNLMPRAFPARQAR